MAQIVRQVLPRGRLSADLAGAEVEGVQGAGDVGSVDKVLVFADDVVLCDDFGEPGRGVRAGGLMHEGTGVEDCEADFGHFEAGLLGSLRGFEVDAYEDDVFDGGCGGGGCGVEVGWCGGWIW